ncbi:MAG: molybdopterin-guanine dinucleotide biosynthesis protein B [Deferribacteraceae bacterium]|jgi:molybdopterin-guanine dinucleotide biosynthesis protein B|nr:molybdopterin-guanine dinucleotide biosynthesis protein B [Deferribacteraceae bacterium]
MLPIVTFTGFSNSGKTTLVSKVITLLTDKGFHVASIKHDGNTHDFNIADSDSVRHKKSGAVCSIVSNAKGFLVHCDSSKDKSPAELAYLTPADADIIICEGFKNRSLPKIEVVRKDNGKDRSNDSDPNLIAVVSDDDSLKTDGIPFFDINNAPGVTSFIEEKFLAKKPPYKLQLVVNGEAVPTKDFLREMLTYSIQGLIKPLKGCDRPKEIIIKAIYE